MDRYDYLIRQLTRIDGLIGIDYERRYKGLDWPRDAVTMVGVERLENVKTLALDVIARCVPGDFMECGIWRGGVGILMANLLMGTRRRLFLADSFEGCPVPDPQFSADRNDPHHTFEFLKVSIDDVRENFRMYGVPAEHWPVFLPGWFKDTLPGPVETLALLRIDADMYESTTQALDALYDKLLPGGYLILDDFHNIPNCRKAILDFRARRGITAAVHNVDWCAVYWQKEANEGRAAA